MQEQDTGLTACPLDDESAPASFTVPVADERRTSDASDDESPPADLQSHPFHFHHQNELQGRDGHLVPKLLCATCTAHKSHFFCFSCVNRGEFTSSHNSQALKDKFCEKNLKLFALQDDKKKTLRHIDQLLQPSVQIDLLQSQVNQQTEKNEQLKESLRVRRNSLQQLRDRRVDMRLVKQQASQQRDLNSRKVAAAEKAIQIIREKVCSKRVAVTKEENSLREVTWDFSVQLRTNIFTLDSYDADENDGHESNPESVPLLGFPHLDSSPGAKHADCKFTVVEPWLPAIPDCSAYSSWVISHKEEIVSTASFDSLEKRNDAFRISAALSYIAHLTDVLSRVLDVHLPRKLCFREFYTKSATGVEEFLTEAQIRHKVAKLDVNVAFLCLSQKVDPNLISIRQAVRNLINLLNPSLESDLGRRGPVPIDSDFSESLSLLLDEELTLVREEVELDCDFDPQLDVDELGYESVPMWSNETTHDFHDQSMMQANSILSPASVLSFFDVSRFWSANNS